MRIFIVGHKSPDLDSAVSAIQYAEYLHKSKKYEGAEIVPVLPGKPNKETQFVLKKFDVETPKLLDEYEIEETDAFILVDHN